MCLFCKSLDKQLTLPMYILVEVVIRYTVNSANVLFGFVMSIFMGISYIRCLCIVRIKFLLISVLYLLIFAHGLCLILYSIRDSRVVKA
jgi:hypothetical protein